MSRRDATRERKFYVYVVELYEKRSVYVGQSALTPEERFQRHKKDSSGTRRMASSHHVRHQGKRLLPHLYEHYNPMTSRDEAREAEQEIRSALERRGFTVHGACTVGRDRGCRL